MRTKSAQAEAVLANPAHSARAIVTVYDSTGVTPTVLDQASLGMVEPVLEVQVEQSVDSFRTARVTLQRQQGLRSLAPLVETGNPLFGSEALVFIRRRIVIEAELVLSDVSATPAGLKETIFDGWIDEIDWAGDDITLACTDKSAELRDKWIEYERLYGWAQGVNATKGVLVWSDYTVGSLPPLAVGDLVMPSTDNGHFYEVTAATSAQSVIEPTWPTGSGAAVVSGGVTFTEAGLTDQTVGIPIEDLINQVLADNGISMTVLVPSSPGWIVKGFKQDRASVMDAIQAAVDQLGWWIRFEWDSSSSSYRLTLAEPDRASVAVDKVLDQVEEIECDELGVATWNIRNVVRVIYSDGTNPDPQGNPTRITREAIDAVSIAKYGRKFMEVAEDAASNIDTAAEADQMAEAILQDLAEPTIGARYAFPVDPYIELGDRITLPADTLRFTTAQTLATESLSHTFNASGAKTSVRLRGQEAAHVVGWLELAGADVHQVILPSEDSPVFDAASIVGGRRFRNSSTKTKNALRQSREIHISASPGFTPSNTTLKFAGDADTVDVPDLVPGKTYYKREIPFSRNASRIVRGSPTPETSFVAGRAKAGHYDSVSTQSHLPLNGNFEHALDDLASAPPDHWAVVTRPAETTEAWGSSGSVYYGTEATTKGRYIILRASATQRGNVVSSAFEVRRGLRALNLYLSVRRQGSSAVSGKDLILDIVGYADSALTNVIINNSIFLSGDSAGPYPALNTWYDAMIDIASTTGALSSSVNFITIGLRRGTAGDNTFSWEIGDVYFQEADFKAATIDALTIGTVSGPSHVRAKTATAGSYATNATIIFGTEDFDSLGEYDPSTGIFTATKAGIYQVSAAIFCDSLSYNLGNSVQVVLQKNGSGAHAYGHRAFAPSTASWYLTSSLSTNVQLAVGDTLRVKVSHDRAAGNVSLFADAAGNYFCIDRIL